MAQSVVTGTYPVVVQPTPQDYSCCGRENSQLCGKPLIGFGITQILIGLLCAIFNIVAIVLAAEISFIGHGIWSGIFFIIAGILAVVSGKTTRTGWVVACMVMSIISALTTLPLLAMAALGWGLESDDCDCSSFYFVFSECCNNTDEHHARIAMHAMMLVLAILEAIIAIITSCLCCHGVCCCGQRGNVIAPGAPGMQMVFIQGQMPPQPAHGNVTYVSNPVGYGQPMQVTSFYQQPHQGQPQQQFMAPPAYSTNQQPESSTGFQQLATYNPPPQSQAFNGKQ